MKDPLPARRVPAILFALSGLLPAVAGARQDMPLPPFHALDVSLPADVTVRQGPWRPVRIDAEPAVKRALRIGVRDGVLVIAADGFRTRQPVRVDIVAPELQRLHAGGTSSVLVVGWRADELTVRASGSSDLQLRQVAIGALRSCAEDSSALTVSGRVDNWRADARGSARIDAEGLHHRQARLHAGEAASIAATAGTDAIARVRDGADIVLDGRLVPPSGEPDGAVATDRCR